MYQKVTMKFVDISGFGHSGKGVVTDLFREFEGFCVPHNNFEFNLIRIQGGLLDLKHGLVDNWSPIRADIAIRRFSNLVKRIGKKASLSKPSSLFFSNGMNYDYFFEDFTYKSERYLESLIDFMYEGDWPYPLVEQSVLKQFSQRIQSKIGIRNTFLTTVYISAPQDFEIKTKAYLDELFCSIGDFGKNQYMVLHNATEPFNPTTGLNMFNDAKAIIIQKDPRDVFVSSLNPEKGFIPEYESKRNWVLKQNFLNTGNVLNFIKRQKIFYSQVIYKFDDHRVLRLRYEDLVLNYDESVKRILNFLDKDESIHKFQKKYFDPEKSAKNVGVWKAYEDQSIIEKIETDLSEYCYNKI